jgi:hypothetical protein
VYRRRLSEATKSPETLEEHQAIWDKVLDENIYVICKTPMAKSITRRTLHGFRKAKTNMWAPDDLINKIKNQPELFIKKVHDLIGNNVKINAIVGNPPYQVMDGGAGASAIPVYNLFVNVAKKVNPNYISLIMPSRWMTGGRGLDDFRTEMITDHHIMMIHDYLNGNECFENVEIKGGVCYFLWSQKFDAKCHIISHLADEIVESIRYLKDDENDDIFIRDPRLLGIKNKVSSNNSFDVMVSSMKPYGLRGDFFQDTQKYNLPEVSDVRIPNGIEIIGLDAKQKRVSRFASKDYPLPNRTGIDGYKIFVPRNYGIGLMGEAPANPILAQPGQACTETFVQIGIFDSYEEMVNCKKYLDTKFLRCIVSIRKKDQGAGKNVYRFVPNQDFSSKSDIDWTKNVADIDRQLYAKYGLTDDEVQFIESMIKPM